MKIRIGFGAGTAGLADGGTRFGELVDALERNGFDSIWCSERATGPTPDPLVALSFAAGRTTKLKLGTSVQVLPGRNPVLLAKQWAALDRLSGGRALPAFGLGVVEPMEQQAFGVTREERAPLFDEMLPLGDGWLPSLCTPDTVAESRVVVEKAAADAGRAVDPEHFGAMVFYTRTEVPTEYARALARRRGVDPSEVITVGFDALRERLEAFVAVGFSKLVPVPLHPVESWDEELDALADAVLDLQRIRA